MSEQVAEQLFDLTLSEDQRMARESMRRFAAAEMRPISRSADEAGVAPPDFYQKTLDLGLALMPIDEAFGGAGVGRLPMSNVLNAEDLGHADMALALGALTPLAFINTLVDHGSAAQQKKYLSVFAEASSFKVGTLAIAEPRATFDASVLQTTAAKQGQGYVLNGVKSLVPLAASADWILVVAELQGEGKAAFIVDKSAAGLSVERQPLMGLRALEMCKVTLNGVVVPASQRLGESEKVFDYQRVIDLSRLGVCALSVGVCQAVLEYTRDYVKERVAFGEPIANRQSVAFMVANIAIELEAMRLMVYRAASRAEQGLEFHREAYLAQVFCAEKTMEIGTNGVQLLGGHGYIREHLVELWYRNLRAVAVLEGCASI